MAKLIYIALFLFASYMVATEAQNCSNPIAEALGIELLAEPAARPSGVSVCGSITGQVCCGTATFSAIETAFETYRAIVDATVEQLKNVELPDFPSFDDLFDSVGGCRDSFFAAYDLTCDDVEKLYNRIINAFKDYYEDIPGNVATCMQGILEFFAGIICFLCDASWGEYISIAGNGDIIFDLATDVCDDVADACLPLYEGIQELYNEVIEAASELGALGENAFGDLAGDLSDICDEDCRQFICFTVISGYEAGFVNPLDGDTTGRSTDEEVPVFFRNMRKAVDDGLAPVRRLFDAHNAALGHYARSVKAAQAGQSQYSENGYEATEVGRDSSLNTEVEGADDGDDDDDSASKLFASILAILAALAILF